MLASRCLMAVAASLLACGEPPEPTRFVASVTDDGGGVSIGLTIQGDLVAGYACGDDPALERYPGWFVGETTGDSIAIEREGWTFMASWRGGAAEGALLEPSGEEVRWSAHPASGLSGTYAARDAGCTTGVVVVDGDPGPLVRGIWCNSDGEQRQVTPLGPMELIDGQLLVAVQLASGPRPLGVTPVELPLLDDR
jgi:hypothetical protein